MNFLIPFGTELLLASVKQLANSQHVQKWNDQCINCICKSFNFQEEFEIEDLVQVESPTTRAYRHPIYQKAMLDWDKVDSLQKAVEWHQQYTPGIAIEDYIHHYITKPTKTTK